MSRFSDLNSEELHAILLEWRDIEPENACRECAGRGRKTYANTATWHPHSIAGQALTDDICDRCWGSGDEKKPWTDLRALHAKIRRLEAEIELVSK